MVNNGTSVKTFHCETLVEIYDIYNMNIDDAVAKEANLECINQVQPV